MLEETVKYNFSENFKRLLVTIGFRGNLEKNTMWRYHVVSVNQLI